MESQMSEEAEQKNETKNRNFEMKFDAPSLDC